MEHEAERERRGTLTDEVLRLVDQSVWANRQWVEFVYSDPAPEDRPRELLGHLLTSERIWFGRIAGVPETQVNFPVLSPSELVRGFDENRETLRKLISARWADIVHFTRATGEKYHATVGDIVFHLLTHGYHHRGQLATHYARKGAVYPNTDHINSLIQNRL